MTKQTDIPVILDRYFATLQAGNDDAALLIYEQRLAPLAKTLADAAINGEPGAKELRALLAYIFEYHRGTMMIDKEELVDEYNEYRKVSSKI